MAQMTNPLFNVAQMRQAASRAAAMLRLLSNEDRLLLLCQLTHGEVCVSELEELLGIRQPTLSQQLGILRHEEIVSTRRDGKRIFYHISDAQVVLVLNTLYDLYSCTPPSSSQWNAAVRRQSAANSWIETGSVAGPSQP